MEDSSTNSLSLELIQTREVSLRHSRLADQSREAQLLTVQEWLENYSSTNTREAYARDFRYFWDWLESEGLLNLAEVRRADLNRYRDSPLLKADSKGKPLTNATRARRLASVASFYDYCLGEQLLTESPVARITRPKVSKDSPRETLSKAQAQEVLRIVEGLPSPTRALISLTLLSGLRISEALSVTGRNFLNKEGHTVIRVIGKGDKEEEVPQSPLSLRLLEEALEMSKKDGLPLVRTASGVAMYRQQASRAIRQVGKLAGLKFDLVPHSLRHTAGTLADEAGAPLERVQTFLRHSNSETTLRYLHSRKRLDNSASYSLSTYLAEGL